MTKDEALRRLRDSLVAELRIENDDDHRNIFEAARVMAAFLAAQGHADLAELFARIYWARP